MSVNQGCITEGDYNSVNSFQNPQHDESVLHLLLNSSPSPFTLITGDIHLKEGESLSLLLTPSILSPLTFISLLLDCCAQYTTLSQQGFSTSPSQLLELILLN